MPVVTEQSRKMQDGQNVTGFVDSVGTTLTTYTYQTTQEKLAIRNNGSSTLTVTVSGLTQAVQPWQRVEITRTFSSFDIVSSSGIQAFEAWSDEVGSTFDEAGNRSLKAEIDFLQTTVNVKKYGAKGDGTDDTAAIQAAIDSLPTRGGSVIFPSGKFLVTSTINITKPVTLIGTGSGDHTSGVSTANTGTSYDATAQGSVVFTNSPTIDVFNVNASGFAATDLAIVNTHASPTAGTGLRIQRGDGAHLTRVHTAGFWNNVSFEQSEFASITDCLFMDPVNYGLWLRNLVVSDQGDMSIMGCAFSYSGSINRTGATAIRWESGGGLKVVNTKINMGPRGGVGKFDYGIYLALANNVFTSVFTITGSSFENCAQTAILARPQGAAGQINKLTITGNEFAFIGNAAIDIEGLSAATPFQNVAIGTNVIDNVAFGVYLKNVDGAVISSNAIRPNSASYGVYIDTGCKNVIVNRQAIPGYSSSGYLIKNMASTTFSDHTTAPIDIDWHDKRTLPSITSTSTWVTLWKINVAAYATGFIDLSINALVQGKGQGSIRLTRAISRGASGATTVTTVGTDVITGFTFDVNFDTTSTSGDILVQIRLNATTGGTDMNGSATFDAIGDLGGLSRY